MAIDIRHGTNSSYCNKQCRCELCKKAHSDYQSKWQIAQRRELKHLRKAAGVKP